MQAGNANRREATEHNHSQRASRTDAEPIVKDLKSKTIGSILLFGGIVMFAVLSPHNLRSKKALPCCWDIPAMRVNTQDI